MTAILITPEKFVDNRGWFSETYSCAKYAKLGINALFCQDNHSLSVNAGTLRGIHFQHSPNAQAKLVRCVRGRISDVAVDLRPQSPTFLKWVAAELSVENGNQLFIPAGYGHAFLTLAENCEVEYKVDANYAPQSDSGIRWNDPMLAISWPAVDGKSDEPTLSDKDRGLPLAKDLELNFPYDGRPLRPLV